MSDKTTHAQAAQQAADSIKSIASGAKQDILKYIDRTVFKLTPNINLYEVIAHNISEIDNQTIKQKYTSKYLLKNNCDTKKQINPLKLDYINSTILKYLLMAEIDDIERDKQKLKQLEKEKTEKLSKNDSRLSDIISSYQEAIDKLKKEINEQERVLTYDASGQKITINKTYLLKVIDTIIQSIDVFSLTHEHQQREATIQYYSRILQIITITTIAVSIVSLGVGGLVISIIKSIINFGSKIPLNISRIGILQHDSQFIRDKYIKDRFNIDITDSINSKSYLQIQRIDEKILNLCNNFIKNKDKRSELIQDILSSITQLKEYIDTVIKIGISTLSFAATKDMERKQIEILTQIKEYYDNYDKQVIDIEDKDKNEKKINNILIDYYNYISDKKQRVEITEDIANTIKKYNDIADKSIAGKNIDFDINNTKDSMYINSFKNTILILLEKYLRLTDQNYLRSKVDDKTKIIQRKIDKLYGYTFDNSKPEYNPEVDIKKIKDIFEKLLLIMKIESNVLSNVYSADTIENIEYMCQKVKKAIAEKQEKSLGEHNDNINIIKGMFKDFKSEINKITDQITIDNLCIDLKYKEPLTSSEVKNSLKELARLQKQEEEFNPEELSKSKTLSRKKAVRERGQQSLDRGVQQIQEREEAKQKHLSNLQKMKQFALIKTFLDKMTLIFTMYNEALGEQDREIERNRERETDEKLRIQKLINPYLSDSPEKNREALKALLEGKTDQQNVSDMTEQQINNQLDEFYITGVELEI